MNEPKVNGTDVHAELIAAFQEAGYSAGVAKKMADVGRDPLAGLVPAAKQAPRSALAWDTEAIKRELSDVKATLDRLQAQRQGRPLREETSPAAGRPSGELVELREAPSGTTAQLIEEFKRAGFSEAVATKMAGR